MNVASLNPWLSDLGTVLGALLGDFMVVLGIFHFSVSWVLSYGRAMRQGKSTYASIYP